LLKLHYRLFGLTRRADRFADLRKNDIMPLAGDLDNRASLTHLTGLADVVLHFAPPPANQAPASALNCAKHHIFTDTRTTHLLAILSRGKLPRHLIYLSTSGVYGDCNGAYINETQRINPQTVRAQRRVDAERQLRNWGKRNGVQITILRVPGIYAADRLPLERLRAGGNRSGLSGIPIITPEEDSFTNHIHADDLARIVVAALRYAKPNRIYHAVDDSEMKMGAYFDAVAQAYNLPRPLPLPRNEIKQLISPTLWTYMNESRRLTNQRMKQELKVVLRFPSVVEALASMPHD
jgi:nucleoside-diphosphate-sugar epimerase